ncbi:hypothetical protein PTKIN_Ptkin17bG0032200 [Pterospermum kingtungense]
MKISWFTKKIRRSNSNKYCYKRVDDDEVAKTTTTLEAQRGYVAIYIGEEAKRYEVPIECLSHPTFKKLLMHSQGQDDLDTKIDGPIVISCSLENCQAILDGVGFPNHN